MRIREQRPIEFRQLCAIARVVFLESPGMTDADWKGATLDACSKQGWAYPEGDMLARAIGAVERALEQTVGKRQVRELDPPPAETPIDRNWTAHDLKQLAETVKRIQARSAGATPTNVRTIARERWEVSEPAALDEFYREAESDRLGALKRFAEIAITRPAEWDFGMVREQAAERTLVHHGSCFACRKDGKTISHHVVQIQHGGSNYVRNRVDLCERCHAVVHPWLPQPSTVKPSGWHSLRDTIVSARELIWHMRDKQKDAS